jgi:hypothetical protein
MLISNLSAFYQTVSPTETGNLPYSTAAGTKFIPLCLRKCISVMSALQRGPGELKQKQKGEFIQER